MPAFQLQATTTTHSRKLACQNTFVCKPTYWQATMQGLNEASWIPQHYQPTSLERGMYTPHTTHHAAKGVNYWRTKNTGTDKICHQEGTGSSRNRDVKWRSGSEWVGLGSNCGTQRWRCTKRKNILTNRENTAWSMQLLFFFLSITLFLTFSSSPFTCPTHTLSKIGFNFLNCMYVTLILHTFFTTYGFQESVQIRTQLQATYGQFIRQTDQ